MNRALLAGAAQNALGGSGRLLLGFLLILLISRLMGTDGAGVYLVAVAVAGVLEAVAESGPRTATVRYVAHFLATAAPARARGTVRTALALAAMVGAVLVVAGMGLTRAGVAQFLGSAPATGLGPIWRLAVASSLPLALTAILLAATRGSGWMTPSNVTDGLVVPTARILLFLLFFWAGLEELGALWAYLLAALVGFGLAAWFYLRAFPPSPGGSDWEWAEVVPYAAAQGGSGVLDVGLFWADTLIIGALLTVSDVGLYGAAVRLALIPTLFAVAINTAFQPQSAARWAAGDRAGLGDLYRWVTRLLTGISLPFYLLLAAFSSALLGGLFGAEFRGAAPVLVILAAGQVFSVVAGPAANLLAMAGFPAWNFWNNAVLLVLNVAANLLLIPRFGIEGAAWAWAGSLAVVNVARVVEVRVLTGLVPYDRVLGRVLALGLLGGVVLASIQPWNELSLGRATVLGAIFGALWLGAWAMLLPSDERSMILGLARGH